MKSEKHLLQFPQHNLFCTTIILTIALVITGFGLRPSFASQSTDHFPTIVQTHYGIINGFYNTDSTVAWTGVPFAKPPIGDLRWKAPQDPEHWDGILDATHACEPCMQRYTTEKWESEPYAIGSEDCLYLSVYRPDNLERKLPIYVFIHGGSNLAGTANLYDGSRIAAQSGMVVVVVQYRLGPLGWFTHPIMRHEASPLDNSGNFGTLDNIKALQWIRKNIGAFGGDPHNVLITGESAGAHNVMNLVISPLAKGLFHKAMSESSGMSTVKPASGVKLANNTINLLLANDREARLNWHIWSLRKREAYLRGLSAQTIIEVGTLSGYDAYEDGRVIPGSLIQTIQSGKYNKVPIILGANQYEAKAFMPKIPKTYGLPWSDLPGVLDGTIPSIDDVLPTQLDKDLYEVVGYYGSRNWRATYVDEPARALKEQQNDVWAYQFNWGGPGSGPYPFNFIYGAAHAMEIPFFFGFDKSLWGYGYHKGQDTPGRADLSSAMMQYLANFAHTGNPNDCESPIWQQWSNKNGRFKVMVFDSDQDQALLDMSDEEIHMAEENAHFQARLPTGRFITKPWPKH